MKNDNVLYLPKLKIDTVSIKLNVLKQAASDAISNGIKEPVIAVCKKDYSEQFETLGFRVAISNLLESGTFLIVDNKDLID